MKRTILSMLLIGLVAGACGSDGDSGGDPGAPDLPDPECVSEQGEPAPDFVGLTEEEAVDLARERGLQVREAGRDGECFPATMDLRHDRVNLEYSGDVVVGAAIY